jgi:hypothetical protein
MGFRFIFKNRILITVFKIHLILLFSFNFKVIILITVFKINLKILFLLFSILK